MPVGPGGAVIVEHARDLVRIRDECYVVQAEVAVEQHAVAHRRCFLLVLVALQDALDGPQEPRVRHHARQLVPQLRARLGPGQPAWQPPGHVLGPDAAMLLGEDAADRPPDPPRQRLVGLHVAVEPPWVEQPGDELAQLPSRLVHMQHPWRLEGAPRRQQVQHPALHGEAPGPGLVHREPRHAVAGQRDGPAILAFHDGCSRGVARKPGPAEQPAGRLSVHGSPEAAAAS